MAFGSRTGWDLLAAIAAVIALVMLGVYVGVITAQGGHMAVWFLAGLAAAALLSIYGAARAAPRRGLALVVSGAALMVLGFLGILSIGFPILCAGVLALVAAIRSRQGARTSDFHETT